MFNGMGGGGFMWPILIVVIAVIIWVAFTVINQTKDRNQSLTLNETPLDILKKRFANGELTNEQFEEMKEKLNAK